MKKHFINIMVVLMMVLVIPSYAASPKVSITTEQNTESVRAEVLIKRIEQIDEMDKSSLSRLERKTLKKELKSINKELKQLNNGGGVYLSVGAVIIITLLLILLV